MPGERLIWVAYEKSDADREGGPVAAFTFTPAQRDIEEMMRRFAESEGYEPKVFLAWVTIYDAPLVPQGDA